MPTPKRKPDAADRAARAVAKRCDRIYPLKPLIQGHRHMKAVFRIDDIVWFLTPIIRSAIARKRRSKK